MIIILTVRIASVSKTMITMTILTSDMGVWELSGH